MWKIPQVAFKDLLIVTFTSLPLPDPLPELQNSDCVCRVYIMDWTKMGSNAMQWHSLADKRSQHSNNSHPSPSPCHPCAACAPARASQYQVLITTN